MSFQDSDSSLGSVQWARHPGLLKQLLKRRKDGASLTETYVNWIKETTNLKGATKKKRGRA